MKNIEEQKIIDLLCSNDLADKQLAFQFVESLQIHFDWERYIELYEWLKEEKMVYLDYGDEDDDSFSDREKAVLRVFSEKYHKIQHKKLKTWDDRVYLLPNLKGLNFSSNSFEEIPKSIKELSKLNHLNLNKNRLTVIGTELNKSKNLEYLSLGHNDIYAIHTDFKELKYLNYLDLAGNKLAELPESIGSLRRLKYLNLSHNPLERLPESIHNLISLEKLYLFNTEMPKASVDRLKTKMPNCDILHSKK